MSEEETKSPAHVIRILSLEGVSDSAGTLAVQNRREQPLGRAGDLQIKLVEDSFGDGSHVWYVMSSNDGKTFAPLYFQQAIEPDDAELDSIRQQAGAGEIRSMRGLFPTEEEARQALDAWLTEQNLTLEPIAPRRGRPQGSTMLEPLATGDVLQMPSDGAMAFTFETLMAPRKAWHPDQFGRPEYRAKHGHIDGSTVYMHPGDERMAAKAGSEAELKAKSAALWEEVAALSAADLQLLMCVSNAWMGLPQATDGVFLNALAYAEARGLDRKRAAARGQGERDKFNASVHRLRCLELHALIDMKTKGKKRETQIVTGRVVMAEAIGQTYTEPLAGFAGERSAEVTRWRLIPGMAWLTSRKFGQIGRYPTILLEQDPRKKDLLIRLGAYLGHQTAVRASSGTLAQPLTVGSILDTIHEPIPSDRRRLGELRTRFEAVMDELRALGVLTSWQWEQEPGRGVDGLRAATLTFLYHEASLAEHAKHHPATKRALKSAAVQRLIPEKP